MENKTDVSRCCCYFKFNNMLREQTIQLLDMDTVENMVVVHDYANASMFKIDKNVKLASNTLIKLFQVSIVG